MLLLGRLVLEPPPQVFACIWAIMEQQIRNSQADPHLWQTKSCWEFLEKTGDLADRVMAILKLMEDLHVNLPIFLWAVIVRPLFLIPFS